MWGRAEVVAAPLLAGLPLALATPASAVDGVIEINQARALAGGVTPGDAAGFPVELNQPGSYRLTGNLTLPDTSTDGIEVNASSGAVVIDLNGFQIIGPGTCGSGCPVSPGGCSLGSGRGIYSPVTTGGVRVHDGGIEGMAGGGIRVTGGLATENVYARGNSGPGFEVTDGAGRFVRSIASRNGGDGFHVDSGFPGMVRDSTPSCNGGDGIEVGLASTVSGSNVLTNGGRGIAVGPYSNANGNTVLNNASHGLDCGTSTGYTANVFSLNNAGGGGVQVGAACAQMGANLCDGAACP